MKTAVALKSDPARTAATCPGPHTDATDSRYRRGDGQCKAEVAPRTRCAIGRALPCAVFLLVTVAFLPPSSAEAAGIQALFNLNVPSDGPFPSDRFTIPDDSQNTWLWVNLPKPDCAVQVSDCQDLDVIDTLDGFNLQPRLSIPFGGPIDVTT